MTQLSPATIPAFKEWSGVCAALEQGHQTLILRKGGISEDSGSFAFEHDEFALFPTGFHQQDQKTLLPSSVRVPALTPGEHTIRAICRIEHKAVLRDWQKVVALDHFHFWKEETLLDRFNYDEAGAIHLAIVRVYLLNPVWNFPDSPNFGGCKSWIEIPTSASQRTPALNDASFASIKAAILKAIA